MIAVFTALRVNVTATVEVTTMLTRDSILSSTDLPSEEVQAPEWGGSVFVRTLSGSERDAFEQSITDAKSKSAVMVNVRAKLAVQTVCDKAGVRLFTDDDVDVLGAKSSKALDRIFDVARRLSGIGADDAKELESN